MHLYGFVSRSWCSYGGFFGLVQASVVHGSLRALPHAVGFVRRSRHAMGIAFLLFMVFFITFIGGVVIMSLAALKGPARAYLALAGWYPHRGNQAGSP